MQLTIYRSICVYTLNIHIQLHIYVNIHEYMNIPTSVYVVEFRRVAVDVEWDNLTLRDCFRYMGYEMILKICCSQLKSQIPWQRL
jgi:hypothetical protein